MLLFMVHVEVEHCDRVVVSRYAVRGRVLNVEWERQTAMEAEDYFVTIEEGVR